MVALVAAQEDNPRLAAAYAEQLRRRRLMTTEIVVRAVERGEAAAELDADLVMEILAGVAAQKLIVSRRPFTHLEALAVVEMVLGGVLVRGPAPG